MNAFSGQAGATGMKHVLIVGLGFLVIAAILTLVTLSVTLSNTAFEVALS
jgi:hypothetical protein